MKRLSYLTISICALLALSFACSRKQTKGQIEQMIEPNRLLSHPLFFYEEFKDKATLYQIPKSTSNIQIEVRDIPGFIDVRAGQAAMYVLAEDTENHMQITRMEQDRKISTVAKLDHKLKKGDKPVWTVTRNDLAVISGTADDGSSKVISVEFIRVNAEPDPITHEVADPKITWNETELLSSPNKINAMTVSPDGSNLALSMPLETAPDKNGMFLVHVPGGSLMRLGNDPVAEVGGFSPDGNSLLGTFQTEDRVELYLTDVKTRAMSKLTESPHGFLCGHPVWHPGGKYLLYSMDYTSAVNSGGTTLLGEELFLYSIDSKNERRLTTLTNNTVWADFAPNGDFLMYCSTPGVPARQAGRMQVQRQEEQATKDLGKANGIETWRVYYIPWDAKKFQTGNPNTMAMDEMQFLVSWTVGGNTRIGFAWGPGGEWVQP